MRLFYDAGSDGVRTWCTRIEVPDSAIEIPDRKRKDILRALGGDEAGIGKADLSAISAMPQEARNMLREALEG